MQNQVFKPYYEKGWALVVGINDYSHIRKLNHAVNDATAFARVIQDRYGFAPECVTLLLDADATSGQHPQRVVQADPDYRGRR